jgi:hypothetical protein
MTDPDQQLRELLGTDPPASVAALDPAARADLAAVIAAARERQSDSLEKAFVATLRHVPFPVRGIVRKVLLG